ncbi:MAG TPA: sialic acid TRAP transporter substrate-binding protein SiaP, partial [Nitriliruptorales bacterium]
TWVVAIALFAMVGTACGDGGEAGGTDDGGTDTTDGQAEGEVTLRFSCSCVPEDHHTKAIYKFEEEVEASTNGAIQVEVFDSGSLFDQTAEQTALLRGDLEMAYASSQWVSERVPAASIVGVPYMITDLDHLYAVMDGEVGTAIFDAAIEQAGIRPLTSLYLGTRHLNLRDIGRQVMVPADLEGVKLRVPDSESWIKMGTALGANPTPVAFGELYLALETGTVDGQDNPLPTTQNAKFYEVTSQISLTGHLVNDVWPTINEEVWQGLSAEHQQAIADAWQVARDFGTEIATTAEAELVTFFEAEGLEVYEPDRDAFRQHVLDQYLADETLTSQWMEGHLDTIRGLAG